MKPSFILFASAVLIPTLASAADYNLGELTKASKIEVFNRALDQTRANSGIVIPANMNPRSPRRPIRNRG
jgi:hypothetical protein